MSSREREDDSTTTLGAVDDLVESLLCEILDLPEAERTPALGRTSAAHPELANALRRRYRLIADFDLLHTDPDALRENEQFGPFRLLRKLGAGMATVYLAQDERSDRRLALKVYRHASKLDTEAHVRFRREAFAAARIEHPGICPIYDAGEIDGTPYLSMRYVPGKTLAAWIEERAREEHRDTSNAEARQRVLLWMEQVLRSLEVAHRMGLVHRDVKPSNIILRPDDRPVLIDFGLVLDRSSTDDLSESRNVVGTPAYMSPEQILPRDRPVGPAADVYAVGATLYECLTLQCPFTASSREALFRRILHDEPRDPRRVAGGIPRDLCSVLQCAMAKEAGRRYATAAAFADDLARVRRREPVRARRRGPAGRVLQWGRRNPLIAGLSSGLACALVGLVALAAVTDHQRAALAAGLSDLDLAATSVQLDIAEADAAALVPGWPGQVPALERWLAAHGDVLAARLADLEARIVEIDGGAAAAHDPSTAYLAETLRGLARRLRAFVAPGRGTRAIVRARLAWARQVEQVTIAAPAGAWRETAVAVRASPLYGGLELPPQIGLIPLGVDERSGLFEFYHPRSGWPGTPLARREVSSGRLVLHDGAGFVFVLIPGGRFTMGAQDRDPSLPHYDRDAGAYSEPEEVELGPFFLSKYEMTIAQWHHLGHGEQPSYLKIAYPYRRTPAIGWRNPVENVSATMCDGILASVGLTLPTEAQWEYASRAGTRTRWSCGDEPADLDGHANVLDLAYMGYREGDLPLGHAPIDDGFALSAPVGSFRPNAFGLHDMIGNVNEWCRDQWIPYAAAPARPGDGLRTADGRGFLHRAYRGGAYGTDMHGTTSTRRGDDLADTRSDLIGLRPARPIRGETR